MKMLLTLPVYIIAGVTAMEVNGLIACLVVSCCCAYLDMLNFWRGLNRGIEIGKGNV